MSKYLDFKINSNIIWIALAIINLILIFFLLGFFKKANSSASKYEEVNTLRVIHNASTPTLASQQAMSTSTLIPKIDESNPIYILSIFTNQKSQLYTYQPIYNRFSRLIDEPYEQIDPNLSQDQQKLAYSAKKNGYWDIYILDLKDGSETRITDNPEYDGSPSWSADGNYIAYESYKYGNLDIFIQDLQDLSKPPIQLTNNKFSQYSPSWNHSENKIAYVSTQNGDEEIWLANLSDSEIEFVMVSNHPEQIDAHPRWSSDGQKLIWTSETAGFPVIVSTDFSNSDIVSSNLGYGDFGLLNSDLLSYIQIEGNQSFLITKQFDDEYLFPPAVLPGSVHGFDVITAYKNYDYFLDSLIKLNYSQTINMEDPLISKDNSDQLVKLEGLDIPNPYMSESVIGPFNHFRSFVANQTGWDLLNQLTRTFIPITDPAPPGSTEDWLYTGRAFELNPLTIHAGLVTTVKEERSGQIYWRVFVKARYQDGSQGLPLKQMPFDLASRYNNDPKTYDQGGVKIPILDGYWVDLTEIALDQNWERIPALYNWILYFESARFNQFVFKNGLDWYGSMKELYPVEAIKTPTPIGNITITPTPSDNFSPATSTNPAFEMLLPTFRPTWTPNQ